MSTKVSSRPKKSRQKDDMKQEIVAQVHKPTKRDVSSDRDTQKTENSEESSESNKNYLVEDKNENYSVHTPSRDVSVDEETQINSKILSLIETEMRRDINKHSHFTDSRPQSLSFYEEEKIPEELSGNLELLSPEERKHYKRRKEHTQIDTDERNMYNSIQDIYSRENDEIISGKKSKSRKKRHNDAEIGMGDSREMMIPKEKKKSKKKKRENSPMSSSTKRKHRKRDEENEPKNDITVALEELQDDVFENNIEDFIRHEKMKKSPRKSDKLYVQKKNRFEVSNRPIVSVTRSNTINEDMNKRSGESPIDTAILIQKYWIPFTTFCHGLLGGLAFAHFAYLHCNRNSNDAQYIIHYANYSDLYTCMFYILCVFCLISVFDRYDIASMTISTFKDLFKRRKGFITIFLYMTTMLIHLATAQVDDKMSLVLYSNNVTELNILDSEVNEWYKLSLGRAIIAFVSWIFISITPSEDLLYVHLKELNI